MQVIGFALAYGACLAVLRLWLFAESGIPASVSLCTGSLIRIPLHMVVGVLLGALLFRVVLARWAAWFVVSLFVAMNVMILHYETTIGELPGADALRYLGAAEHLRSSLLHESFGVAVQTGAIVVALWLATRSLRGHSKSHRPKLVVLVGVACLALTLLLASATDALPPQFRWAARHPLGWFALAGHRQGSDSRPAPASRFRAFQSYLGHEEPFASGDPGAPLCGTRNHPDGGRATPRDVVMIVIESVGVREVEAKDADGEWLMPNLRRMSREGFSATNFHAVGTQSSQALPALLSGQPGDTAGLALWRKPLGRFEGLPAHLGRAGFDTAYFHGGDLSFEQQRQFLRLVGIDEFVELDPHGPEEVVGWGYPDHIMLDRLRKWIEARDSTEPNAPYFVVLATLSSHHPYEVPSSWRPRVPGTDQLARFHNSLQYLDAALGEFFGWYSTLEAPNRPVLVVVSDHASLAANTHAAATGGLLDFDIPFIVLGLEAEELERLRSYEGRLASQFDVPATIAGLVGVPPASCDQGLDVMGKRWPEERVVYAVGGRRLNEVHAFTNRSRFRFEVAENRLTLVNASNLGKEGEEAHARALRGFLNVLLPLGRHLYTNGAYAPAGRPPLPAFERLPDVEAPIYVSHRGNSDGFLPFGEGNRLAAVQEAIQRGFEWVEVDIQITADGVPVLVHDREVLDADGKPRGVDSLTLEELRELPHLEQVTTLETLLDAVGSEVNLCLEIKPQRSAGLGLRLAHEVARMVGERKRAGKLRDVIVDSFSFAMISSVSEHCDCQTAIDLPFRKPVTDAWLHTVRDAGIAWIYIHKDVADAEVIDRAHAFGLKVMVYTLNPEDTAAVERLANDPPDGIITDKRG